MTHTCPTKSKTLKYVCPTRCKTMKYVFHTSRSIKLSCPSPLNIETENARVGQHASLEVRIQKSEVRSRDRGMGRWGDGEIGRWGDLSKSEVRSQKSEVGSWRPARRISSRSRNSAGARELKMALEKTKW